jgi:hypothetical protein
LKNDINVPSKISKQKHLEKTKYFLLASLRSLTKRAESGPETLVRDTDPQIQICTKMSRIRKNDGSALILVG